MASCSVSFGKTTVEIHPSETLVIVQFDGKKIEITKSEDIAAFFLTMETIIAARKIEARDT